jgi:hypothetical protein
MPIMFAPKALKKATSPARSLRVCPGSPTITPVPTCGVSGGLGVGAGVGVGLVGWLGREWGWRERAVMTVVKFV